MNRVNKIFKIVLVALIALIALAFFCVSVAQAQEAATLQLLPEAQVDSTGIFLEQIVHPSTATAVIPHLRLAQAPNLGQTASFSRRQITELVEAKGYEIFATNWSGAAQVRVSRRTRQFADAELIEMLTTVLQRDFVKDRGQLELRLAHPFGKALVPDELLTLKVGEMPSAGIMPSFLVTCELWNGKEHVGDWQVAVLASIWRDVPVAHSTVPRGCLLKDADIAMERRDVLAHRDYYLNDPAADDSLEVTDVLQPGTALLNHSVRVRPLIQRGHVVEAVFQDGTLSISLKVEALEDGAPGQLVRVRNPKTKREIYGKVQNEQTVLIAL
jgi:flagella basal body P-ring formation protein FlgA